jgi:hypothetical protein
MKQDFVIKMPFYMLGAILVVSILAGGATIIWILLGYLLGSRVQDLPGVGKRIIERAEESNREYRKRQGLDSEE